MDYSCILTAILCFIHEIYVHKQASRGIDLLIVILEGKNTFKMFHYQNLPVNTFRNPGFHLTSDMRIVSRDVGQQEQHSV